MKKRTIIDIILIFVLLGVLIFLGQIDYKQDTKKDSKRFDKDYSMVSKDNVFKYTNDEELYDMLNKGKDIVVFFGFKENEWCNYYAKMLNDSAKEVNLDKIYYYDFLLDREKGSTYYKKILNYFKENLRKDDMGKINLMAPSMAIIKNKTIMYFDDETSFMYSSQTPKQYWNENTINNKMENIKSIFEMYLGGLNGGEE